MPAHMANQNHGRTVDTLIVNTAAEERQPKILPKLQNDPSDVASKLGDAQERPMKCCQKPPPWPSR